MKIVLNGEEKTFIKSLSVADLVGELKLDSRKIAVECNMEIVPSCDYSSVFLNNGVKIEIVHFIGGG